MRVKVVMAATQVDEKEAEIVVDLKGVDFVMVVVAAELHHPEVVLEGMTEVTVEALFR